MNVFIVLPSNNPLDFAYPKPVVSAMMPYVIYSKYKDNIKVISPYNDNQISPINTIFISKESSKKKNYYRAVLNTIKECDDKSIIIEVHQDIRLAGLLAKNLPTARVVAVKHADYAINSFRERFWIVRFYYYRRYMQYLEKVFCNSNYVKETFISKYKWMQNRFFTLYNSYGHILDSVALSEKSSFKKNEILFAGKPVQHKGIKEFIMALPGVLNNNADYTAVIVGAFFSKKNKYTKELELLLQQEAIQKLVIQHKIVFHRNLSPREVFSKMLDARIVIVPTKTNEPFGLVCLEAHLAKCAVITSGRGGLREISDCNAVYLDRVTSRDIAIKINFLLQQPEKIKNMAIEGFNYAKAKFDPIELVKTIDLFRAGEL